MSEQPRLLVNLSSRGNRVLPALEEEFAVITFEEAYSEWYYSIPILGKFLKAIAILFTLTIYRPKALLVDSFGFFTFLIGILAKGAGSTFVIRTRGGMWGEFNDEARVRGLTNTVWYTVKKDIIRNQILYFVDGILAVSYFQKIQMLCELNITPEKIHVVYEPVNNNNIEKTNLGLFRQKYEIPYDSQIISTVTSYDYDLKYQGIKYFLPAIVEYLDDHPNAYFVIAGSGTSIEPAKDVLQSIIPPNLQERIIITGYYSPIEEIYIDSNVYVHLSFRESMGQPVLEAQSAGLPVIVNNGGGMAELLYDKNKSYIVNEPSDLIDKLVKQSEGNFNFKTKDAAEWVESEFSDSKISQEFKKSIYEFSQECYTAGNEN